MSLTSTCLGHFSESISRVGTDVPAAVGRPFTHPLWAASTSGTIVLGQNPAEAFRGINLASEHRLQVHSRACVGCGICILGREEDFSWHRLHIQESQLNQTEPDKNLLTPG